MNITKLVTFLTLLFLLSFSIFTKDLIIEDNELSSFIQAKPFMEMEANEKVKFQKQLNNFLKIKSTRGIIYKDELGKIYTNSYYDFELYPKSETSQSNEPGYVEYSLNNSSFQIYSNPISIKDEGQHSLVYRSVDGLKNVEKETTLDIIVDKTPPKIDVDMDGKFYTNKDMCFFKPGAKLNIRAKDKISGLKMIIINRNKEGYEPLSDENDTFINNGEQLIYVRAIDKVLNITNEFKYFFTIDGVKPKVKFRMGPDIKEINGETFCIKNSKVYLDAHDEGAGIYKVEYSLNQGETWNIYKGSFEIKNTPTFQISYRAFDNLGNVSDTQKFQCKIDTNPPSSKIKTNTK